MICQSITSLKYLPVTVLFTIPHTGLTIYFEQAEYLSLTVPTFPIQSR